LDIDLLQDIDIQKVSKEKTNLVSHKFRILLSLYRSCFKKQNTFFIKNRRRKESREFCVGKCEYYAFAVNVKQETITMHVLPPLNSLEHMFYSVMLRISKNKKVVHGFRASLGHTKSKLSCIITIYIECKSVGSFPVHE
jgi:hypothetical protein